jgi:hypothetical protein
MKPSASDADRWKSGDKVCLMVSACNPPTMDLVRAVDVAFSKGFSTVWLCPLFVDDEQARCASECCEVFCSEYYAATSRQLTYCSVALDKKFSAPPPLVEWLKKRFPFFKIAVCMLASEKGSLTPDAVVTFRGQESSEAKEVWPVSKYVQSPAGMADRIRAGSDESRWFQHALWEFLIEKGLYRNK